jgi:hypothetical protein
MHGWTGGDGAIRPAPTPAEIGARGIPQNRNIDQISPQARDCWLDLRSCRRRQLPAASDRRIH